MNDAGARKFRSGEGDLGLLECDRFTPLAEENVVASIDYAYSAGDFETSLKILGLGELESIDFAQQLRSDGAIVTVAAGFRIGMRKLFSKETAAARVTPRKY